MPRTSYKLSAPPKTDPLLRTRRAVNSPTEAATGLRSPRYTAQRVFYRSKDAVKTSTLASPLEASVLIQAVSLARRILRLEKSEYGTEDGLQFTMRLAIGAELVPPAAQLTTSVLRERVSDWMKGANMVVYVDDGIEAYGLSLPDSDAKDIYIAARLVQYAVSAQQLQEPDAYKRSILHLAVTICQECQHLMRGAILGPVKSIPSGCSTREDHRTTFLDRYMHFIGDAGWFWADAVVGGEIVGIIEEEDQNDSPVYTRLAVQNGAGHRDYHFIEDSVVRQIVGRGKNWFIRLPIRPRLGTEGTEVPRGLVAAAARRHVRAPIEVPPGPRLWPEDTRGRRCARLFAGPGLPQGLPEMEGPPRILVLGGSMMDLGGYSLHWPENMRGREAPPLYN